MEVDINMVSCSEIEAAMREAWLDSLKNKNNDDGYSKGKKLQLSISPLAMSILKADGDVFFGPDAIAENAKTKINKNPITYMVNTIIENFAYESEVNPDEYMSSRRQMFQDSFLECFEAKKMKKNVLEANAGIINKLVYNAMEREKKEFIEKNVLPTYSGEKVYIDANSIAKLENVGDETIVVYRKPYKFVSALIENYTRHTFSERERIIRKEKYNIIENAIDRKLCLQIELNSKKYVVKPIEIIPDNRGNYLLCMSSNADEYIYTTQAPRISNIKSVTKLSVKGSVTKEEKLEAFKYVKDKGIANVGNERKIYKVKMTNKGKEIYRRIVSKDVSLIKIEGDIYYMECSEYTICFFLRSFGKEAVVLDKELKERYISFYKEALEAYEG